MSTSDKPVEEEKEYKYVLTTTYIDGTITKEYHKTKREAAFSARVEGDAVSHYLIEEV